MDVPARMGGNPEFLPRSTVGGRLGRWSTHGPTAHATTLRAGESYGRPWSEARKARAAWASSSATSRRTAPAELMYIW